MTGAKKQNSAGHIKRFAPYYKPHLRVFTLDLLCALGVAVSGLVFPMLVRFLLNDVEASGISWTLALLIAALMLFIRTVEMLCNYYMTTVGHIMGSHVEAGMRRDLYTKLLTLSNSFYDQHQTGDLMSRVNNDLFEITEFAHHCPEELLMAGVRIAGVFTYLMFVDVYLTLILFALMPPLIVFAVVCNRRMKSRFAAQRVKISEINSHLEDSLAGISVIKSFGNEHRELERFEDNNREFVSVKRKTYKVMGLFHSGMLFASGLMYAVVTVFGVWFISLGWINTVDLLTYMLYVGTLLGTVQTITAYFEQFQRGMSGFRRFLEIMDEPLTIVSPEDPALHTDFTGDIQFDRVTFSYAEAGERVLKNLTFTVKRGETVAIVGPSGVGKTTVANLIPRFYDIADGDIRIGGVSIKSMDLNVLRGHVGSVQQNVYLFYGSVKDNILFGRPDASDEAVLDAAKRANAHEFIENLAEGYDTVCGERGAMLSGGQKQRIAIARLFLKNPPILILDEATSALDNENERLVQRSLEQLSEGRTTLIIAHRLTTVKNADRILVLGAEGIVEEGRHEALLAANGAYAALYKLYAEL
ncbi:MAG: ABC transporter ATP-binding protein/permease [Clostridiales bacterium]|jgi:ATP-binding cassette subfamily B protein|nr:ABC transporter ATP-binding protein/permease [Clostridiales bacterium]